MHFREPELKTRFQSDSQNLQACTALFRNIALPMADPLAGRAPLTGTIPAYLEKYMGNKSMSEADLTDQGLAKTVVRTPASPSARIAAREWSV